MMFEIDSADKMKLREILRLLITPSEETVASASQIDQSFRQTFLLFASETEDNVNAMKHIHLSECNDEDQGKLFGLNLVPSGLTLSKVANCLEDLDLPPHLKATFPSLSESEWSAFTRIVTILFLLLESRL